MGAAGRKDVPGRVRHCRPPPAQVLQAQTSWGGVFAAGCGCSTLGKYSQLPSAYGCLPGSTFSKLPDLPPCPLLFRGSARLCDYLVPHMFALLFTLREAFFV